MPRTKRRRRGRPSAIAKLTVAQLMAEVERRRSMVGSLVAQRGDLTSQLEQVNSEIAELESIGATGNDRGPRRGRGRPRRTGRGRRAGIGRISVRPRSAVADASLCGSRSATAVCHAQDSR